jgi:hypothetical protein
MERQNITLSLPVTLLKKAKVLAAQEEISLSQLMKESLETKLRQKNGFIKAQKRQQKYLSRGFNLGTRGRLDIPREELHAR